MDLRPKQRSVFVDGIGALLVRRPTYGELLAAANNQNALEACVCLPSGEPLFVAGGPRLTEIDHEVATALITEVMRPRPTQPPSGGTGETQPSPSA